MVYCSIRECYKGTPDQDNYCVLVTSLNCTSSDRGGMSVRASLAASSVEEGREGVARFE